MVLRACVAALVLAGCGPAGPTPLPPTPTPVLSNPPPDPRPGVLYETELWAAPATGGWNAGSCSAGRNVPVCGTMAEPRIRAGATQGNRIVLLVERDTYRSDLGFKVDLLVSDDLGQTMRLVRVGATGGNGQEARLLLTQGRIFLLVSTWTAGPARLLEVDADTGILTLHSPEMSGTFGAVSMAGVITTVGAAGDSVAVTRFDPATRGFERRALSCPASGFSSCAGTAFVSSDGETFRALDTAKACQLTVHASGGQVETTCPPGLVKGAPFTSWGQSSFTFRFQAELDVQSLTAVVDQGLAASAPVRFETEDVRLANDQLLVARPKRGLGGAGTLMLRAQPDGRLQQAPLQLDGCFEPIWFWDTVQLDPWYPTSAGACPRAVVWVQPASGDEVLVVTEEDEFKDDHRFSRRQFKLVRSTLPFVARP